MLDYTYKGDPRLLPTSILAYIGDGVYELYTRLDMIDHEQGQVKGIHHRTIARVNAKAQAAAAYKLMDSLTEEELLVFKRGRNTHSHSMAKNADPVDYQVATGFETLIGYLYLMNQKIRLKELLLKITDETMNPAPIKMDPALQTTKETI